MTAFCLVLAGCGADEAIRSANEIPDKMDTTNGNMSKMIDEMKKTTSGVHDQSLLIPMENILKSENHDALSPVPFKLMPYGKKLAEAATATELIELTYLWLKEVDESLPAKDIDESGNEVPYSRQQVAKINNEKLARIIALQVIAGFTPQTTIDEIVQTNIVGSGQAGSRRFEQTALSFLMLRTMFIRDVMLQESLLSGPLDNVGKVEESIKYAKLVDSISKYRFASKIGFRTRGLIDENGVQLPSSDQPQELFDTKGASILWGKIHQKAHADLLVTPREVGGNTDEDKRIFAQELKRAEVALAELDSYVKFWEALALN